MKTSDAGKISMTHLGDALVTVIGGTLNVYDMDHGLVLNREFISEKHSQHLEITKVFDDDDQIFFNVIFNEKEKVTNITFNSLKLFSLSNLYVTIPNLILGEKRKISLLTAQEKRFIVIDFTDRPGINIMSGIDRRGDEKEQVPHEKRRKFVKL